MNNITKVRYPSLPLGVEHSPVYIAGLKQPPIKDISNVNGLGVNLLQGYLPRMGSLMSNCDFAKIYREDELEEEEEDRRTIDGEEEDENDSTLTRDLLNQCRNRRSSLHLERDETSTIIDNGSTASERRPKKRLELNMDIISAVDQNLLAAIRHIVIPMCDGFFDINASTRSQLQQDPIGRWIVRLVDAISFLLSEDGLPLCWGGYLPKEVLPEALWERDAKGKVVKNGNLAKFPIAKMGADVNVNPPMLADDLNYAFIQCTENEQKPLFSFTMESIRDLQLRYVQPTQIGGREESRSIPKSFCYVEYVPRKEQVKETGLVDSYPRNHLIPEHPEAELGCVNMHFCITDWRINIMRGFYRWHQLRAELIAEKPGLLQMSPDKLFEKESLFTFCLLQYYISPQDYVRIMSLFCDPASPPLETEHSDFIDPRADIIFRSKADSGKLDLIELLSIRPATRALTHIEKKFILNSTVMEKLNGQSRWCFEHSLQMQFFKNFLPMKLQTQQGHPDEGIVADSPVVYSQVYIFPKPNRVFQIPSEFLNPLVCRYALFPFYNKTSKNLFEVNYAIDYKNIDDELKRNIPVVPLTKESELRVLEDLRSFPKRLFLVKEKDVECSFLMDRLREEIFGVGLFADSDLLKENYKEQNLIELVEQSRDLLIRDIHNAIPDAPGPATAAFKFIAQLNKADNKFSLFDDLYDPSGLNCSFYDELDCYSNYLAFYFSSLDKYYAIRQSHKNFYLTVIAFSSGSSFEFDDKITIVVTGRHESGKSHAFLRSIDFFTILGTIETKNSETEQVINTNNPKSVGALVYSDEDDADSGLGIHASNNHTSKSGSRKSEMSHQHITRQVAVYNPETGKQTINDRGVDKRGSSIVCTNQGNDLLLPMLSRIHFINYIPVHRGMSIKHLETRRARMIKKCPHFPALFEMFQKKKQAFTIFVRYFIRGMGIPFNQDANMKNISDCLHQRFLKVIGYYLPNAESKIGIRLQIGRIFPYVMAIVIDRVYVQICSGVLGVVKGTCLVPGALYDLKRMLVELYERDLLIPTIADYAQAISLVAQELNSDCEREIMTFIKTSIVKSSGKTPSEQIKLDGLTTNWHHHHFEKLFLNEWEGDKYYVRNYNYFVLNSLCGNISSKSSDKAVIDAFASMIQPLISKSYNYSIHQIKQCLDIMMSKDDEDRCRLNNLERNQVLDPTVIANRGIPEQLVKETNVQIDSPHLQIHWQIPQEAQNTGIKQPFLIIRSAALNRYKTNFVYNGLVSNCCPHFKGCVVEDTLKYLSHKHVYPCKILLPGMTLDEPVKNGIFKPCPQIMKVLEIKPPEDKMKWIEKGIPVELNVDEGAKLQFDNTTPPNLQYYDAYCWGTSLRNLMKRYGWRRSDGNNMVLSDDESIEKEYKRRLSNNPTEEEAIYNIHFNNSAFIEVVFNKMRTDWCNRENNHRPAPDYIDSELQREVVSISQSEIDVNDETYMNASVFLYEDTDEAIKRESRKRKRIEKEVIEEERAEEVEEEEEIPKKQVNYREYIPSQDEEEIGAEMYYSSSSPAPSIKMYDDRHDSDLDSADNIKEGDDDDDDEDEEEGINPFEDVAEEAPSDEDSY